MFGISAFSFTLKTFDLKPSNNYVQTQLSCIVIAPFYSSYSKNNVEHIERMLTKMLWTTDHGKNLCSVLILLPIQQHFKQTDQKKKEQEGSSVLN